MIFARKSGHTAAIECGLFAPADLAKMRTCFDRAWNALPFESRTPANRDTIATTIMRLASRGERDPVRLSEHALKGIVPERSRGTV